MLHSAKSPAPRLFGLIPAAGFSRRMGQPKLLIPLDGQSLIQRVLSQLGGGRLAATFLLAREDDIALRAELQAIASADSINGADPSWLQVVLTPRPTADMKASLALLIKEISRRCTPRAGDGCLLLPADHPVVDPIVLQQLVDCWRSAPDCVIVPEHRGRRGHPVLFPWTLTDKIPEIPADRGFNWLWKQGLASVLPVACEEPSVLWDLDTPADLAALRARFPGNDKSDRHETQAEIPEPQ